MRVVVGWQGSERNAASTNTMSRFETETLTQVDNLQELARMNTQWAEGAMAQTPHQRVILDMDSSESPVYVQREGAAYNGHFKSVCYHPLFCFNQFGDCEGPYSEPGTFIALMAGRDSSSQSLSVTWSKSLGYAIRLPANEVLQREIDHLLTRPTHWPSCATDQRDSPVLQ
jgi:DDE family transposase